VGGRFRFDGLSVIWMEEAGQHRFIDDSGKLFKVVKLNANSESSVTRRAA
jgi:hypothetical protein